MLFRKKYFNLGKDAPAAELTKIFAAKAASKRASGYPQRLEMVKGAIEAFREGRPENLQALFADKEALPSFNVIPQLWTKSDDKAADLALALEKMPEDDKKEYLHDLIAWAAAYIDYYGLGPWTRKDYEVLFEAGATVTPQDTEIMLLMISSNAKPDVIELLHEKGIRMQDTILEMLRQNCEDYYIEAARVYKDKFEAAAGAKPPVSEEAFVQMLEVQKQMAEQIRALTATVARLQKDPAAETPLAAAPVVHPLSNKPYPHI